MELRHHGILGQEWGVRNGPPYPLDKKTIKSAYKQQKINNKSINKGVRSDNFRDRHTISKGTIMYRTSANPNESLSGPKYVSYLDVDRNNYKGGWVRLTAKADKAYEYKYLLTEDLKVPSRQELKQVINKCVSKNRESQRETVNNWLTMAFPEGSVYRSQALSLFSGSEKQRMDKLVNEGLKQFKNMSLDQAYFYTAQTFGTNTKIKNDVIKTLKRRGYNAMTDEAGVGGRNGYDIEGGDPLIVFDGNVLQKQSVTPISAIDEKLSAAKYDRWARKVMYNDKAQWSEF